MLRSFPTGLLTLDIMQVGKEASGEELPVTKDVSLLHWTACEQAPKWVVHVERRENFQ